METNQALPEASRLSPRALIGIAAAFCAFLVAIWRLTPVLLILLARHPYLRPVPALVGAAAGLLSYLLIRRLNRQQAASREQPPTDL